MLPRQRRPAYRSTARASAPATVWPMKLITFSLGAAVGYVLGAKAGQERYEQLVAVGRRVVGSQTVQSIAGVVEGKLKRE